MVYLYYTSCLRYTILIGNPRYGLIDFGLDSTLRQLTHKVFNGFEWNLVYLGDLLVWWTSYSLYLVHLSYSRERTLLISYLLSCLSRSLADRLGTTVDLTTSFLHSSRFSAFRSMIFYSRPVHFLMLSSHRFPVCLFVSLLELFAVYTIVLASPVVHVRCPYNFSLCHFTEVRRSSYGPIAFPVLAFTSSLVMWSLYEIPRSLWKHLISNACIN